MRSLRDFSGAKLSRARSCAARRSMRALMAPTIWKTGARARTTRLRPSARSAAKFSSRKLAAVSRAMAPPIRKAMGVPPPAPAAVMPKVAAQLWQEIGAVESGLTLSLVDVGRWGQLRPGVRVVKGNTMFPRIEEPDVI